MAAVALVRKREWHSTFLDMCAQPGGVGLCCYVLLCPTCAAGDIAAAAGRSYLMSCLICPLFCQFCYPGHLAGDRQALADKYGIEDMGCVCATILFVMGLWPCLLYQELNHVRAADMNLLSDYTAVTIAAGPVMVQPQQPMYAAAPPPTAPYAYQPAQPAYVGPAYSVPPQGYM